MHKTIIIILGIHQINYRYKKKNTDISQLFYSFSLSYSLGILKKKKKFAKQNFISLNLRICCTFIDIISIIFYISGLISFGLKISALSLDRLMSTNIQSCSKICFGPGRAGGICF